MPELRAVRPEALAELPVSAPCLTEAYGPDPMQFGELRLPTGDGPHPIAVIVHGGCWTKGFATLAYMRPLADRLAAVGLATWTIEYRQVGDDGGGWPGTFLDWAAGLDHVRTLAARYPLDLSRVVALGHSAGGHAGLWLAARPTLDAASPIRGGSPLKISAAVSIDGPGDLVTYADRYERICGGPVIAGLMGGRPDAVPSRYADGDPVRRLPLGIAQVLIASTFLTPDAAADYQTRATVAGDRVEVLALEDAGHFDMLAPGTPSGALTEALILRAVGLGGAAA
ncbi:MAG TPA: alpha/beta hydrolase [Caulobacteraceae bacterium]|jgi:acetyl esterase/lipase